MRIVCYNFRRDNEAEMIEKIVADVLGELSRTPSKDSMVLLDWKLMSGS